MTSKSTRFLALLKAQVMFFDPKSKEWTPKQESYPSKQAEDPALHSPGAGPSNDPSAVHHSTPQPEPIKHMFELFNKHLAEADKAFVRKFEHWVEGTLASILSGLENYLPQMMESRINGMNEILPEVKIAVPRSFLGYRYWLSEFYKQVFARWGHIAEARTDGNDIVIRLIFKDIRQVAVSKLLKESVKKFAPEAE